MSSIATINGGQSVSNINCDIHLEARLASGTVTVDIPSGSTIMGDSGVWSTNLSIPAKIILPPIVLPEVGDRHLLFALEIGSSVSPLHISKGVRISLGAQTMNQVGSISNNTFAEITDTCTDDSQATGDALTAQQACKIISGSSLIIWTKHFTEFITYDLVRSSTTTPSKNPKSTSLANLPSANSSTDSPSTSTNPSSTPIPDTIVESNLYKIKKIAIFTSAIIAGLTIFIIFLFKRRGKKKLKSLPRGKTDEVC
jgi:hypothetical protein